MIKATADRLRKYLRRRHIAYNLVFSPNIHVDIVLRDLAKFCRAHDSTFHKEDRAAALMEGRREVWLRIMENLNLTTEQIYSLHRVSEKGEDE